MYLPPLLEKRQDIVFVYLGPRSAVMFRPDPSFMTQVEQLADSIMPTAGPVPFYMYQTIENRLRKNRDFEEFHASFGVGPATEHRTYYDTTALNLAA
eukprot:g2593.t1